MTGSSRSVLRWYCAKRGVAAAICCHACDRSVPCSCSAVTPIVRPPDLRGDLLVKTGRGGPADLDMRDGPSHSSFMIGRQPAEGRPDTLTHAGPEPRGDGRPGLG